MEQEQKNEEKRRREEQKEEERRKKEEEKRQKDLEDEAKRKKAAQAFTKFFKVNTKATGGEDDGSGPVSSAQSSAAADDDVVVVVNPNFMPFAVKGDMKLAPTVRRVFNGEAKRALDAVLKGTSVGTDPELYIKSLKTKSHVPLKGAKTWASHDSSDEESEDELMVVGEYSSIGSLFSYYLITKSDFQTTNWHTRWKRESPREGIGPSVLCLSKTGDLPTTARGKRNQKWSDRELRLPKTM